MIHDERISTELLLRYKQAFTKISDCKRDYTNAAIGYISLANTKGVDAEAALELFNLGLACAIIAPASNRKQSILSIIQKDDRSKVGLYSGLLNKFATGMLIKPSQTVSFSGSLAEHQ